MEFRNGAFDFQTSQQNHDWYELIDKMGGDLKKIVTKTIINESEKQNKKN
ncbi:putative uncharacterized plasmid protein [Lactococcus cremoris subsp. cremoris GE214]|uniref:Uncharacterized plasmid protein n=1 Tax=Lactococcus cremoris subsp. cremoris GE214 TaxID=1415168 RepID=A0A084A8P6_LACLC|nr:putative uncharacterized plasmid protein [Lactococcus cremoris subsp. cremoris GE214]